MSQEELSEIVKDFLNICDTQLKSKQFTKNKDVDFYIKKGICLNEFKNIYLEKKEKFSKKDLREYVFKVTNVLNDWLKIMKNHQISKGLQKCIPASSSYLVNVKEFEVLNGDNKWIPLHILKEDVQMFLEDGMGMKKINPEVLIDTGGFGPSLISMNLFSKLDNKVNRYKKPIILDICGDKKAISLYYTLNFRFTNNKDKVYNINCGLVQDIGIFKYGIFLANDFLKKYKDFNIRQDINDDVKFNLQ